MTTPAPRPLPTRTDFDGTRDQIVALFASGKSRHYISTALALPRSTVDRIIKQEFDTRLGNRQSLIERTALEIEYVKAKAMEKIEKGYDRRDAETWLKLNESLRRLFGLDQPVKAELKVSYDELSEDEIIKQLAIEAPNLLPALPPVEDAEFVGIGETELESVSSHTLPSPPLSVPLKPPTSTPDSGEPTAE